MPLSTPCTFFLRPTDPTSMGSQKANEKRKEQQRQQRRGEASSRPATELGGSRGTQWGWMRPDDAAALKSRRGSRPATQMSQTMPSHCRSSRRSGGSETGESDDGEELNLLDNANNDKLVARQAKLDQKDVLHAARKANSRGECSPCAFSLLVLTVLGQGRRIFGLLPELLDRRLRAGGAPVRQVLLRLLWLQPRWSHAAVGAP